MKLLQEVIKVLVLLQVCCVSSTECNFYSHHCKTAAASPGNREGQRAKRQREGIRRAISFKEHFNHGNIEFEFLEDIVSRSIEASASVLPMNIED